MMHHAALLLTITLVATSAIGGVYSWKDASGKTHYGDQPPADLRKDSRKLADAPPADELAQKPAQDKSKSEKEKSAEGEKKPQQEDPAQARLRRENCIQAKANLTAIETEQVRFKIDAKGERIAMEGAVRDAELTKARRSVSEWCSPPKPAAK